MTDDQSAPVVEAPKPPPLTIQAWSDKATALIDEAIAADLPWGPALAAIVAKRGKGLIDQARTGLVAWIDHGLELLESGGNAKAAKQ